MLFAACGHPEWEIPSCLCNLSAGCRNKEHHCGNCSMLIQLPALPSLSSLKRMYPKKLWNSHSSLPTTKRLTLDSRRWECWPYSCFLRPWSACWKCFVPFLFSTCFLPHLSMRWWSQTWSVHLFYLCIFHVRETNTPNKATYYHHILLTKLSLLTPQTWLAHLATAIFRKPDVILEWRKQKKITQVLCLHMKAETSPASSVSSGTREFAALTWTLISCRTKY